MKKLTVKWFTAPIYSFLLFLQINIHNQAYLYQTQLCASYYWVLATDLKDTINFNNIACFKLNNITTLKQNSGFKEVLDMISTLFLQSNHQATIK